MRASLPARTHIAVNVQEYIQIETTAAERADLERIGRTLVERQLAACTQIEGPIESTYRWNGAVETATEWRCTIKTLRSLYDRVESAILAMHPYDTPEIIASSLIAGSRPYLSWIDENTGG